MFQDWVTRKEVISKNIEQRASTNKEFPRLARLEAQARTNFRVEMERRQRFPFQSIPWWRCDERAQVWHEVATLLCGVKNGK